MPRLTESYLADCARTHRPEPGAVPSDLESTLAVVCERGRAAHPDLSLDDATFVAHLARCEAPVATGPEAVFAEDLFLASAALVGVPGAAAKLQRKHRRVVATYLGPLDASKELVAEVEQVLWSKLLVGDAREPAKLYNYSGKGALGGFVGISAQRLALDMLRRHATEERGKAAIPAAPGQAAGDPEFSFIKRRYRDGFQQAIRDGLALLDDRERMIYRMKVVDGLSSERVAKVYGVDRATVTRWLARAREKVLSETRRVLRKRLQLSASEFESMAGLMVSQLDVSVSNVLRQ
jgi:RNA polymerase sigma-70 factor (ECF subfamily)